jgi:hypothetical protein
MTDEPKILEGAVFVCEVPKDLGAVTKLEKKGGKIIARTESGTSMIVPVGNGQSAQESKE